MRLSVLCALCLFATGTLLGDARGPVTLNASQNPLDHAGVVERFLKDNDRSLVSYRALRRLEAAARGGKMHARLTAWTTVDVEKGFQYEVVEESGSGMIRSKVLRAALEAEREARRRDRAARSALTEANYEFTVSDITPDGFVRVAIHPKRKDAMLIEGSILLTNQEADLVRIEGLLVKRPSFWTRRVQIVRRYARIAGVRVPIAMGSTADVLLAGQSTFSMDYEYESINGLSVTTAAPGQTLR